MTGFSLNRRALAAGLALPFMARVAVGSKVILEITQHGKVCHEKCAIYRAAGDCVMPREGIFARVITGGPVHAGDPIRPVEDQ